MRALLIAAVLGLTVNAFANEPAATPAPQEKPAVAAESKEAAPADAKAAAPAHKKDAKKKAHGHK